MSGHVDRAGGGGTGGGTSQVKANTRVHLLPPPPTSPYPSPSSKKPKDQPHAFLLPTRPLAASSEQARLCLETSFGLRQASLPWIRVLIWRQQWGAVGWPRMQILGSSSPRRPSQHSKLTSPGHSWVPGVYSRGTLLTAHVGSSFCPLKHRLAKSAFKCKTLKAM